MTIRKWVVILEVPQDEEAGEEPPAFWNWTELCDTTHPVFVVGTREICQ